MHHPERYVEEINRATVEKDFGNRQQGSQWLKVKQNTDKIISAFKAANDLRNSSGFGDAERNDIIVTGSEQLLEISEYFYDLEPIISTPRRGLFVACARDERWAAPAM